MSRLELLTQQRDELNKRIKELAAQDQRASLKRINRQKLILGSWLLRHRPELVKEIIKHGLTTEKDKSAFADQR